MEDPVIFESWLTSLLDGRTLILLFYALGIISLVLASIMLQYHWKKYGTEIPSTGIVKKIYFSGAVIIAILLTAALNPLL